MQINIDAILKLNVARRECKRAVQ